ncbi:hypothetical protein ABB37_01940 [Leptomonas pyrrhocoris]|uniref:Uncharacterized protein n=1 Tax=Leptomonas pyrrhocoris TaxID=157538 RepID=A0A0N0VGU8_LEPPY|nr:hypothetical protein ABB37_01940 [Leptomonas pyrrhocoris]KPA83684.1 hypothetical protein ABB37_01940 [Leptomonas pyrrhocoris]|eukprot:XP_015662123.1 hypothetical protein ABB37_01940 [Leptomonas pyrrhocoris]
MPFDSSSSSSSWAASPAVSGSGQPRGNARFRTSMQMDGQTCILVGSAKRDAPPTGKATDGRQETVGLPTEGNMPPPVSPARRRRIYSSFSSSSATYSDYSYSASSDRLRGTERRSTATTMGANAVITDTGADGNAGVLTHGAGRASSAAAAAAQPALVPSTALSPDPYAQVQQQLHHPRLSAQQVRRGGSAEAALQNPAGVPGWWSCESSVLPDGSAASSSSASLCAIGVAAAAAAANTQAALPGREVRVMEPKTKGGDRVQRGDLTLLLKKTKASSADVAVLPSTSSSSSCGCATSCSCRTEEDNDDDASDAGTTPTDTSRSSDDGSDYPYSASSCSCCRHPYAASSAHSRSTPSTTTEPSTLCSSCAAAARTHVLHFPSTHDKRHGGRVSLTSADRRRPAHRSTPFVEQDVFLDAVRGNTMWAEVPPLLHLSMPANTSRGKDDMAVRAGRERAELRAEYIRQAALLAGGKTTTTAPMESADLATATSATALRLSSSTQTDEDTEETTTRAAREAAEKQRDALLAEERLRGLAAAQCAEVALPMMQRELESYETRASALQQHQLDVLRQQLQDYQTRIENQRKEWAAELDGHRARWELEQQRTRELEELRQKTGRKDQATSFDSDNERAATDTAKHAVGTQHSDGSLERLAAVQSEAAAWLTNCLLSFEEDARRDVEATEEEARQQLCHVLEGPSRRVLLRCQMEVLQWQQRCVDERRTAAYTAELRALQLQEAAERQEVASRSSDGLRYLWDELQERRRRTDAAAVQREAQQTRQRARHSRERARVFTRGTRGDGAARPAVAPAASARPAHADHHPSRGSRVDTNTTAAGSTFDGRRLRLRNRHGWPRGLRGRTAPQRSSGTRR